MSHFVVYVIGENVEDQLQPYHEYECTGIQDEYVVWVDQTAEINEHWDRLDAAGKAEYGDREQFAEDYYGCEQREVDGVKQWGRMTNPNKKWDWWQIGGRWSGQLLLKKGASGTWGTRSWMNKDEADDLDCCDAARKGDIDVQGLRDRAASKASKQWHLFDKYLGMHKASFVPFATFKEQHPGNIEAARNAYWAQPLMQAKNDTQRYTGLDEQQRQFFIWCDVEKYLVPHDEYVASAAAAAFTPFAVVKDGQWYEKGEMGWWACVTNEKEQGEWNAQFNAMFDALPDDTLITVVDCHI